MIRPIPFVPNAITAFGLICGLFIIFKVNMVDSGEGSYEGQLMLAGLLLVVATADLLDGAIAKAMKVESLFGGFFDSLADAISFGVAPSVIVLKSLSIAPGSQLSILVTVGAMLYSLCGVLRLVRFNVASIESGDNPELLRRHKRTFTGLPIPAGAAALVSANLFLVSPEVQDTWAPSDRARAYVMAVAMAFVGYLMISNLRYPSFKALRVRVSSFSLVFLVVVLAVIIFFGMLNHFPVVFVSVAWGYVLLGWIYFQLVLLWRRKRKNNDGQT